MHGVDKMDTEGNSKEGKLENLKEEGLGGVNEGKKDHDFGLGITSDGGEHLS